MKGLRTTNNEQRTFQLAVLEPRPEVSRFSSLVSRFELRTKFQYIPFVILDKYSQRYEPKDLIAEWRRKVTQFETVQSDFPEQAHLLDSLKRITQQIADSSLAEQYFPGTALDQLSLSRVENQKVIIYPMIHIQAVNDKTNTVKLILVGDENANKEMEYPEHEVLAALESGSGS